MLVRATSGRSDRSASSRRVRMKAPSDTICSCQSCSIGSVNHGRTMAARAVCAVAPGSSYADMAAELSDPHLVTRAKAGRLDAFEELMRRHRDRVYRIALRMLGNESDAEDATQDAFVQAWTRLPEFRAESQFSTWMHRIATNRCLD